MAQTTSTQSPAQLGRRRLRRYLIEHRFNAAQGRSAWSPLSRRPVAAVAGAARRRSDHRGRGSAACRSPGRSFEGRDEAVRDGLVLVTEASMAVSAKGRAAGRIGAVADSHDRGAAARADRPDHAGDRGAGGGPATAERPTSRSAAGPRDVAGRDRGGDRDGPRDRRRDAPDTRQLRRHAPRPWPSCAAHDVRRRRPTRGRRPGCATRSRRPLVDGRPAIAVVIDDLGLNRRGTAALNQLKAPLTLSFLPYAGAPRAAGAGRRARPATS